MILIEVIATEVIANKVNVSNCILSVFGRITSSEVIVLKTSPDTSTLAH